ncbi:hypothetical protein Pmani_029041 [Petrolisthes manimaculis]|uniref:Uncharacterized protein n=1 Tax=Petrolisthes manimaculis TaxID=1843537 RepID=A0AAE1TUV2_9EUCA|nr:hypothetical protein Pmani_029041 [Petrolisthes manimaculis]
MGRIQASPQLAVQYEGLGGSSILFQVIFSPLTTSGIQSYEGPSGCQYINKCNAGMFSHPPPPDHHYHRLDIFYLDSSANFITKVEFE